MISIVWYRLILWQILILGGAAGENKTRGGRAMKRGSNRTPQGRMNVIWGEPYFTYQAYGDGADVGERGGAKIENV